jgi:GNAT superfamily N-acetyltransferase
MTDRRGEEVMPVETRVASASDEVRCMEMMETLTGRRREPGWSATFGTLLERERGEVLVAHENGVLLGMATVSYNLAIRYAGEYCQLEELIVEPAARGKKVGELLVRTTISRARSRGCAEYGLYLIESTEKNRPFYEKCGIPYVGSEMRLALGAPDRDR